MNKSAFYTLSYGVYICTTWDNGRPTGCVANSAMQVTSSPATVAVSINKDNYTCDVIKRCGYFAICPMAEDGDPSLIGTFGFRSGKAINKFAGFDYSVHGKLPVPEGVMAYISCKVINAMETSTHIVFLGEVFDADVLKSGAPMTYAYYHKALKGKAPKNAPTYIGDGPSDKAEKGEYEYVCPVCGYVYDGETPFEELPDDWKCPLCKVEKSKFIRKKK